MNDQPDKLLRLLAQIDDAKMELEEALECGDLEEQLDAALRVQDLENEHLRAKLEETGGG